MQLTKQEVDKNLRKRVFRMIALCATSCLVLVVVIGLTIVVLTERRYYNWEELFSFYLGFAALAVAFYLAGTVGTIYVRGKLLWNLVTLNLCLAILLSMALS